MFSMGGKAFITPKKDQILPALKKAQKAGIVRRAQWEQAT